MRSVCCKLGALHEGGPRVYHPREDVVEALALTPEALGSILEERDSVFLGLIGEGKYPREKTKPHMANGSVPQGKNV